MQTLTFSQWSYIISQILESNSEVSRQISIPFTAIIYFNKNSAEAETICTF